MLTNIFKKPSLNISIQQSVGILHLSAMVTENIYGFIFSKTFGYDSAYMTLFLSIPLSWLTFKNECIISYLVKKHENPQYHMGSNPENSDDLTCLFPSPQSYYIFYNVNHGLRMVSVIIVNYRSTQIPQNILIPTLVLYTLYVYGINHKRPSVNGIRFKSIFLGLLLASLYHTIASVI